MKLLDAKKIKQLAYYKVVGYAFLTSVICRGVAI
jgi:hypothetical protein